jgi:hypothetical protein
MAKVELALSAQRIYQDLAGKNGSTDSYQSVKRFVRKPRTAPARQLEQIWRLEFRNLGMPNREENSSWISAWERQK